MNTATGAKTGGAANRGRNALAQHVLRLRLERRERKNKK